MKCLKLLLVMVYEDCGDLMRGSGRLSSDSLRLSSDSLRLSSDSLRLSSSIWGRGSMVSFARTDNLCGWHRYCSRDTTFVTSGDGSPPGKSSGRRYGPSSDERQALRRAHAEGYTIRRCGPRRIATRQGIQQTRYSADKLFILQGDRS